MRLTESNDELTDIITPDLLLLGEVQGDEPTPPPSAEPVTIWIELLLTTSTSTVCKLRICSGDAARSRGRKKLRFRYWPFRHQSVISLPFTLIPQDPGQELDAQATKDSECNRPVKFLRERRC